MILSKTTDDLDASEVIYGLEYGSCVALFVGLRESFFFGRPGLLLGVASGTD